MRRIFFSFAFLRSFNLNRMEGSYCMVHCALLATTTQCSHYFVPMIFDVLLLSLAICVFVRTCFHIFICLIPVPSADFFSKVIHWLLVFSYECKMIFNDFLSRHVRVRNNFGALNDWPWFNLMSKMFRESFIIVEQFKKKKCES